MEPAKCKLFDMNAKHVKTIDVEYEEPYFPGQGWRLPECVLHEGRLFQRRGVDTYGEQPRTVILRRLEGESAVIEVFHPLPTVIVTPDKRAYVKVNEDIYMEAPCLFTTT